MRECGGAEVGTVQGRAIISRAMTKELCECGEELKMEPEQNPDRKSICEL